MTESAEPGTVVLLVTRNLPPLRGGMERLNLHLALALSSKYDLAVAGPAGCAQHLRLARGRFAETPHRLLVLFLLGCAVGSLRIARRLRPKLVVAGSGLTAPLAWVVSQLTGARTVVYLHGLDLVVANAVYRRLWLPMIRKMQLVLVNSRNTALLAQRAGIPAPRIRILHPGTDLAGRNTAAGRGFRERYNLGNRPLLLSIGRLTPRKGVAEFVERVLPVLLKSLPETMLLVIGDDARDSIHRRNGSQLAAIVRSASKLGVEAAVRILPPCDDATLSAAYSAADVHVFPVRELPGDVEGFGIVAIEAAAHGLPTVGFDAGGVADAVVEGRSGELVRVGDYPALAAAIERHLARRDDIEARLACIDAARSYGWDRFNERLQVLLAEPINPQYGND